MTIPTRTLRALRTARTQLRDLAAATHAVAAAASGLALGTARARMLEVEETVDAATGVLGEARSTADLMRLADEISAVRDDAAAAAQAAAQAAVQARTTSAALAGRERQLRSIDMLVERREQAIAVAERKDDQRLTDDHGSRGRER